MVIAILLVGFQTNTDRAWALPPHKTPVPAGTVAPAPGPGAAPGAPPPIKVSSARIFDDAANLKQWIDTGPSTAAEVWALLKVYHVDPSNVGRNPFLKNIGFLKATRAAAPGGAQVTQEVIPHSSVGTALFSADSVANALGSLIAQRFKEEAELVALQDLARYMNKLDSRTRRRPLTAALPRTMGYLGTLNPDTLDLNDWGILQSDIKVDVAALPENLPAFLDTQFDAASGSDLRYLTFLAASGAAEILRNGRSPYEVIDTIAFHSGAFVSDHGGAVSTNVKGIDISLNLTAILSHMLTQNGKDTWRSIKDVEDLVGYSPRSRSIDSGDAQKKYDGINLLLGLSYAADGTLYAKIDPWLKVPVDGFGTAQLDAAAALVDGLAGQFDSLRRAVQTLQFPLTNIADVEPMLAALGTLGKTLCDRAAPLASFDATAAQNSVVDITGRLKSLVDIVGDVKAREYPAAIGETVTYLQVYVFKGTPSELSDFLKQAGPFLAEVASAKSSADAEAALEHYSLPAGSYTQKQQEPFSVTLNAYFGVTAGAETLLGNLAGTGTARTRAHLGFTAPVGLDFNWGQVTRQADSTAASSKGTGFFQTGAWSLFVPVLDVGAVASWRLGSGGGQLSSLTWSNIVAPGLYVVWAKRGSPFSIMVGAQYGPELTKVSTGGGNTIERAALQFPSIQFTFDIPIFNLYQVPSARSLHQ
jgi:hypothetical protein